MKQNRDKFRKFAGFAEFGISGSKITRSKNKTVDLNREPFSSRIMIKFTKSFHLLTDIDLELRSGPLRKKEKPIQTQDLIENWNYQNLNRTESRKSQNYIQNQRSNGLETKLEERPQKLSWLGGKAKKQTNGDVEKVLARKAPIPNSRVSKIDSFISLTRKNRPLQNQLYEDKIIRKKSEGLNFRDQRRAPLMGKRKHSQFSTPLLLKNQELDPIPERDIQIAEQGPNKLKLFKGNVNQSFLIEVKFQPWLAMNYSREHLEDYLNSVSKRILKSEPCLESVQFKPASVSNIDKVESGSGNSNQELVNLDSMNEELDSDAESDNNFKTREYENPILLNILEMGYLGNLRDPLLNQFRQQVFTHTVESLNIFKIEQAEEAQKSFFKYINLQIPVPQKYFLALDLGWRTKAVCYVFCKSFNKKNLFRLFENFWPDLSLGNTLKSKSGILKL